ncbi:MAG TPA: UDP-N-acetylglucosamine 2-epimerase (non-hydrolyzing) [Candidatus Nanoarchaeia archaeon]|nr:UDP-N-acetylglucosamine 2-epimerase (non-hydrolyzing) [Candidatus Nanoarchaeia archaeon]
MKTAPRGQVRRHWKIFLVVGARPNIMKVSAVWRALQKYPRLRCNIVHTGQHYDEKLSKVFFKQFGLPRPMINLQVGSLPRQQQIALTTRKFAALCKRTSPDLVVVVGDTNSTLGAAQGARRCGIRIAHVEAGLRSFDTTMPEELNRRKTDQIADFLFVTERSAIQNLVKEGIPRACIYFTGNTMVDTLVQQWKNISNSRILKRLSLQRYAYSVVTLHRPSNVDRKASLEQVLSFVCSLSQYGEVILPLHPRTAQRIKKYRLRAALQRAGVLLIPPLGYWDFLHLLRHSKFIVTDSGGVQEEATFLRVPCFTLRNNTERPVTITQGSNTLLGTNIPRAKKRLTRILARKKTLRIPELWDGGAGERIAAVLAEHMTSSEQKFG